MALYISPVILFLYSTGTSSSEFKPDLAKNYFN